MTELKTKNLSFKKGSNILLGEDDLVDLSPDSISVIVNKRENKINDAVMVANDDEGKTYLTNLQIGDTVVINFAYVDDNTENWTEVFNGIVVGKEPAMDADSGAICKVQLYAYPAIALNRMRAKGLYSVDPDAKDTLREILVTGNVGSGNEEDFPYEEYFTEDCTVQDVEGDNFNSDWNRFGANTSVTKRTTNPAPAVGTYYIKIVGPLVETPFIHSNYDFSLYKAQHGFPLFLDSLSNPQYDPATNTWSGIPFLEFYMMRTAAHHDIEIQLKANDTDYVRFQITDQNHGYAGTNLNLVPIDGEWHKFKIPIGSRWATQQIEIDDWALVTPAMTDDASLWNMDLREFLGWDFLHSNMQGEHQNWEGVMSINFLVTKRPEGTSDTNFYIDGLKFTGLGNPMGIITDYVNKVFGLESSGYGINTDNIMDNDQLVPYCKFVYEPVTKCLKDIVDLVAGYNWANRAGTGIHWTMIDSKLCIALVSNHHLPNAIGGWVDDVWALNTKYDFQHPLLVGADIIKNSFRHYEPEANFVIVNGTFVSPPNDDWMQIDEIVDVDHTDCQQGYALVGNGLYHGQWSFFNAIFSGIVGLGGHNVYSNHPWKVSSNCVHGPKSLRGEVTGGLAGPTGHAFAQLVLGNPIDLNLIQDPRIVLWVNSYALDKLEIRIFTNLTGGTASGSKPEVLGADPAGPFVWGANLGDGDFFWRDIQGVTAAGETGWVKVEIPIGQDSSGWHLNNHATWAKPIKAIVIKLVGGTYSGWAYIDSLQITGQVIRVAKSTEAITLQGGVKTKLINELLATAYSQSPEVLDPLDYIAVQEVMRDKLNPVVGQITIPYDPDLLGGQRIWIKSPDFNIYAGFDPPVTAPPKQFRILYVTHIYNAIEGAQTRLTLTDDLINSYPIDPTDLAAQATKAVNPDFQTRDYLRLKVGSMIWDTVISKIIDVDTNISKYDVIVNSAHPCSPASGAHEYEKDAVVYLEAETLGVAGWKCVGYTGTGDVPASGEETGVIIVVTQNSSITWIWEAKEIFEFIIMSEFGHPNPTADYHYYEEGTNIYCSVEDDAEAGYHCVGYTGTGSVPSSGSDKWVVVVLDEDSTLTWLWEAD